METKDTDEKKNPNSLFGIVSNRWERSRKKLKELDPAKIRKALRVMAVMSVWVPCAAINLFAISRIIDQAIIVGSSVENFSGDVVDFDPSLGTEVQSANGRALVIVHQGFGRDVAPWKYKDNESYTDYLGDLEMEREVYLNQGDVVVVVEEGGEFAQENHVSENNVVYFITNPNNGFPDSLVAYGGKFYNQNPDLLFQILRRAGVKMVEMGGEFRNACVSQVKSLFENAGFKTGWCTNCVYPQVQSDELHKYPPITYDSK
ncbi:MAG: hypothetical protein UW73_C0025G0021 [Microgenomates group bacterium GW2011_GWB1_44_8]|nr:MAG: hypothetical protein UW73_C0025G0021 [Microgenomates group bacterium GW2011_GWB1_44_8]